MTGERGGNDNTITAVVLWYVIFHKVNVAVYFGGGDGASYFFYDLFSN